MATQTTETNHHTLVYAIAGIVAILFGVVALVWPGLTLALFVLFFAGFAIVSGAVSLFDSFRRMGQHETWWPALLIGIIGIVAGAFVLAYPGVSAAVLLWTIAFWAVVIGIIEVIGSFAAGQFLLLITGVLTVVFGLIMLANPVAGALALVFVIGVFAIARGILLLFEAFRSPQAPTMPA
jgi:uncharacterized membrane protein HdeD (DUF308 family)